MSWWWNGRHGDSKSRVKEHGGSSLFQNIILRSLIELE